MGKTYYFYPVYPSIHLSTKFACTNTSYILNENHSKFACLLIAICGLAYNVSLQNFDWTIFFVWIIALFEYFINKFVHAIPQTIACFLITIWRFAYHYSILIELLIFKEVIALFDLEYCMRTFIAYYMVEAYCYCIKNNLFFSHLNKLSIHISYIENNVKLRTLRNYQYYLNSFYWYRFLLFLLPSNTHIWVLG